MGYELELYAMRKLLEQARRFVNGALPTHLARGGEADRVQLLQKIDVQIFNCTVDQ